MPNLSNINIQTSQRRGSEGLKPVGSGYNLVAGNLVEGECTNPGTLIKASNLFLLLQREL